jgi:hypothetical protein
VVQASGSAELISPVEEISGGNGTGSQPVQHCRSFLSATDAG